MSETYTFVLLNADLDPILIYRDLSWDSVRALCNMADELGYSMKVFPS